jgi:hypothetical protein
MRFLLRGGLAVVLVLLVLSSCSQKTTTKIEWATSLEEAFQLAAEKNQPIVADFWRDG